MELSTFRECVEIEKERQVAQGRTEQNDDPTWHLILSEEVGEIADAILTEKFAPEVLADYKLELFEELVQCVAVIESWIGQRDFDPNVVEIMRQQVRKEIDQMEPPPETIENYIG